MAKRQAGLEATRQQWDRINAPNRGDLLYYCDYNTAAIKTVIFLEQGPVLEGCSDTWLVRDLETHQRIRCSIDSYHRTKRAALEWLLAERKKAVITAEGCLEKAHEYLDMCEDRVAMAEGALEQERQA